MPDGTVTRTVHEEVSALLQSVGNGIPRSTPCPMQLHMGPFSTADHKLRLQRKHAERLVKSALKSTMKQARPLTQTQHACIVNDRPSHKTTNVQMGKEMLKGVGNSIFNSIKGAAGSLFGRKKKK